MTETIYDVERFVYAALKAVGIPNVVVSIHDSRDMTVDAFAVSDTEWPSSQTVEVDGYTSNPPEKGFEVSLAVPVAGSRDVPPDVDLQEVGKFTRAVDAAEAIVKGLTAQVIANALRDESEAWERQEIERQAKEVF